MLVSDSMGLLIASLPLNGTTDSKPSPQWDYIDSKPSTHTTQTEVAGQTAARYTRNAAR